MIPVTVNVENSQQEHKRGYTDCKVRCITKNLEIKCLSCVCLRGNTHLPYYLFSILLNCIPKQKESNLFLLSMFERLVTQIPLFSFVCSFIDYLFNNSTWLVNTLLVVIMLVISFHLSLIMD